MENIIECKQEVLETIARSLSNIVSSALINTNKVKLAENIPSRDTISLVNYMTNDCELLILTDEEIDAIRIAVYEAVKTFGISDMPSSGYLIPSLSKSVGKLINKLYLEAKTKANKEIAKGCSLFAKLKAIDPKYTIDERYSNIWFSYGFDDKLMVRMGQKLLCNISFDGIGLEAKSNCVDDGVVSASEIFCGEVKDSKYNETKIALLYKKVIDGEEVFVTPGISYKRYKLNNYREYENHVVSYMPVNEFLYNVGLTSLIKKSYNIEEHFRIMGAIEGLTSLSDEELETLPIAAITAANWWANAIQTSIGLKIPTEEQIETFKERLTSNIIFDVVRNPKDFLITNSNIDYGLKEAMEKAGITRPSIRGVVMSITPSKVILNQENEHTVLYDGTGNINKKPQI